MDRSGISSITIPHFHRLQISYDSPFPQTALFKRRTENKLAFTFIFMSLESFILKTIKTNMSCVHANIFGNVFSKNLLKSYLSKVEEGEDMRR